MLIQHRQKESLLQPKGTPAKHSTAERFRVTPSLTYYLKNAQLAEFHIQPTDLDLQQ